MSHKKKLTDLNMQLDGDNTFTVTDARERFADVVSSVAYSGKPVVITKNGKKAVVVVPYNTFELLAKIEALLDVSKAQVAFDDYTKNGGMTLDELKREIGSK